MGTAWYDNQPDGLVYAGKVAYKYKGNMPGGTSITLTDGTSEIAPEAFYGCPGLTSITIPNSVTYIGSYAFYECSSLTSVVIPNSVTSIEEKAFYNTYLKSVTIGSGVLSIGSNAFSYDSDSSGSKPVKVIWLTNTPPSRYEYVKGTVNYVANDLYTKLSDKTVYPFLSSMFEVDGVRYVPVSPSERTCDAIDCLYNETAENINIGTTVSNKGISLTVKQVHPYALYGNTFVKDVKLSLGGNIGYYAFYGCTGIANVEISNQGDIGNNAFSGCTGIANVEISNQGNIGYKAFYGCTSEFSAKINNQGYIGSSAFANSTGLKTLEIGNTVTNINSSAFSGCSRLTTAQVNNKGKIAEKAFQSCTSLQTATLGQDITSIGGYAFNGCSKLESIVIPDAVTELGAYAFQKCSSMTSAKIGSGLNVINSYTFYGCSALTNLQIGSNVKTIGACAFDGCSSLPAITIPSAVTDIKNYVFDGCTKLSTVIMEDKESELKLGSQGSSPLFADCPLDFVYIGRNISYSTSSSDGYSPFYRNTSLRAVTITDKETEISENEFYGCTNLKNVTIGDGVTTIGNWAFSGCSSLDYFAFGSSVESIGQEAFSDCTAMTRLISHAATPPTCGSQALDDINKWNCTLSVPQGQMAVYQQADQWKEFFFISDENDVDQWFTLTYMVDGEVYKTYDLPYGASITPESEPTKAGYTFSGWSLMPETMPANDVTVTGSFLEVGNSVTITISAAGRGTYCSTADLDFSSVSDLKAYIASGYDWATGTVLLTRIQQVPAGTGIMVVGAQGSYDVPTTTTAYVYSNLLKGIFSATTIPTTEGDCTNYILANGPQGVLFYKSSGSGQLAAYRAYLSVPTSSQTAAPASLSIRFDDGESTGIGTPSTGINANEAVYNLQGQRIMSLRRGLNIVGGRKVFVK